jgi:hypothetical protein
MKAGTSRVFLISQANPVNGVNASHVVINQPTPPELLMPTPHDGPTGTYTFAGFGTSLPVINSLTPTSGSVGSLITIRGSSFTKALGVTFNGFPASHFHVNDDQSITVSVPAGATSGKIGVRGPAGTGYSTSDFTVVTRQPPVAVGGRVIPDPTVTEGDGLFSDMLDRGLGAQGTVSWAAFPQAGSTRPHVAGGFGDAPAHRGQELDRFYATYLQGAAEPAGRAFWADRLLAGAREAEIVSGFLTSEEYRLSHAGSDDYLVWL